MPVDTPLNTRQLDVLRWINDGCPDGRWTDFSFKKSAGVLAWRRLVTVSKRGGVWSAAILPAGVHYLDHGKYPPGHWDKRRRDQTVDLGVAARTPMVAPTQPVAGERPTTGRRPAKKPVTDELTPTRKLLKDIIDAGGILEIDTKDDKTSYRSLVGIINRRNMAPNGQEVIMLSGTTYHHVILRLSDVSDWKTEPPAQTVAAERIGKWHPAVATLRDDKRFDSIDKRLRGRAFRLLHALAREAEARGHSVRVPRRRVHGYVQDSSGLDGDLVFKVEDIDCSVSLWQPKDQLPHVPTKEELERAKKYEWSSPPSYDYVPADRLSIAIDTNSRWSSKVTWAEKKGPRLESRLPDVMTTFERWAVIDAERNEAERRAAIEKQKRREREDELAREAYVQHALGERLTADLKDWELVGRLRHYLADMADRIEHITDDAERAAAAEWLQWCQQYMAKRDPFAKPICQPKIKPPGYSEIAEFRTRLGFGSGYW
ncbi:MAG: DUF4200 domain-containing protein [Phycisphaerae bacterium]|nr:DUF4200 domain-containing protein [Phycisphaerae bacterium]